MCYVARMSYFTFIVLLQTVTVGLAKQCSYTSFSEVYYYTCLNSQYCCGRDSCCYSNDYYYGVYDLWYFWFCLCFGIFICSLASGAYYRKRQLRGVQVAAIHGPTTLHGPGGNIQAIHGQPGAGGPDDLIHHPPHRNIMVTTTSASGQPMYHQHGYYGEAPPSYPMYSNLGGPMYPAYAYMPPPPAYNTVAMGQHPSHPPISPAAQPHPSSAPPASTNMDTDTTSPATAT